MQFISGVPPCTKTRANNNVLFGIRSFIKLIWAEKDTLEIVYPEGQLIGNHRGMELIVP